MSIFDKIGDASVNGGGDYLGPGHFIARIDSAKQGENRHKEANFNVGITILSTLDSPDTCRHTAGQEAAKIWKVKSDYFLGDVKLFFANILGVDPEDITTEMISGILESDALVGEFVEIDAYDKPNKSQPGKMFTVVTFKRSVPASELNNFLDADAIKIYLGGQVKLDALIAAEVAEAAS